MKATHRDIAFFTRLILGLAAGVAIIHAAASCSTLTPENVDTLISAAERIQQLTNHPSK